MYALFWCCLKHKRIMSLPKVNLSVNGCMWKSFIFVASQQTFVLMKMSFVFILRRRLQDVLVKTNIFVLAIRLQDVFKTFSRRLQDVFKISCQDVFKTSSRHLQDIFPRCRQDVFKTSWRRLEKTYVWHKYVWQRFWKGKGRGGIVNRTSVYAEAAVRRVLQKRFMRNLAELTRFHICARISFFDKVKLCRSASLKTRH